MTSTEIVRHEPTATLPEKMEWARALATSNLLPRQYQNNPGNLLFAVEYADALGVSRINAITSIHVIEGKPSASADLIAALVRRAGHTLRVLGDDTFAEAHLIRFDDPEFTYRARWDMDKARAAGLTGKGVWKSYPGAMLRSRVITEVARMGASDALFGVIYTPEELGAEVDADGEVVHQVTTARAGSGADRARTALGVTQTGGSEGSPAETSVAEGAAGSSPAGNPSESSPESITDAQIRKLAVSMRDANLTDRDQALAYVAGVIGRTVGSRNELTKDEASRVIDALENGRGAEAAGGGQQGGGEGAAQESAAGPSPTPGQPDRDGIVEAELVDDDPNAVWQEILRVAGEQGMFTADVEDGYSQWSQGLLSSEASAAELRGYLTHLQERAA
jgi:hypothetical protein